MSYLLFAVLMTVWIFVCFKGFGIYQIKTLQAITINYATCVITGLIFTGLTPFSEIQNTYQNWVFIPPFLGISFVIGFYFMSITTQQVGMSITTVANRISLIIPVIFSLLVFKTQSRPFSFLNYLGLGIGLFSVILSSYAKPSRQIKSKNYWMPFVVFLIGGFIDTSLNYSNLFLKTEADRLIFPITVFAMATIGGTIGIFYNYFTKHQKLEPKSILAGIILGMPNYFSIYYIIKALEAYKNNGAFVFPIFNILTLLLSSLVGIAFFKEKLHQWNYIGLLLALGALILLMQGKIW